MENVNDLHVREEFETVVAGGIIIRSVFLVLYG